ncbi:MAG: hypothetical protein F6K25_00675 [Okeania sp. SIO2G4]|uniref:MAC/perforin domain-containing protein n=1 Tax=unclassified Okeania TaxID=2634635 RepID=UPI0013B952C4|nr:MULTISPECIES: MAC/perforin domain-containing protein [unclassified Okeania]NEP38254.1 hypothetical protein [Okeania sp. SIO2H7]NEP70673.1 hypothetical protein [Okeania sp. SIO2G5]NEP91918.1 hypothetical protein [Okeania sp. SIO2F5]NEQ89341.1 hypothetical protein [Okeania sp. SIO2G4]
MTQDDQTKLNSPPSDSMAALATNTDQDKDTTQDPGPITPEQIIQFLQKLLELIQPATAALPGEIIKFLKQVLEEVIQPTATQFQLAAAQSVEQITPGVIKHFFQDLIDDQKVDLYRRLQLKKALTVSKIQSQDEDWVISKAFKEAIYWKLDDSDDTENTYHPNWIVPRKNGFFTVDAETSLVAHQVGKFVSKGSGNQELSLFGGLDSDLEGEFSGEIELSAKSKTYLLAEYTIPKLILSLDWENIELDPNFKKKVDKILIDDEWSSFVKLNYLLNKYGYFVPLKFTIGGKISAQSEVNSKIDSNSQQFASFQSSFASKINLFGSSESEASGELKGKMEAKQEASGEMDMELEYYGGLGSAITNPIGWMMSLNSYKTWTVIKYSELVPIICFFDEKLRNKAIRAFMRYSYYPDTNKPLLLNGISYASLAIELISQRSFLEESQESEESGKKVTVIGRSKKFKRLFSFSKIKS